MSEEKSPFEDSIELTLKGTPEMAFALIAMIAQELEFHGIRYFFDRDPDCSTEIFIEGDLGTYSAIEAGRKAPIAVVELYLLPENETLFRIPPRRYWGIPEQLSIDPDHSLLTHLLKRIFTEFQRLGFIDFREEKPPIGFRVPPRYERTSPLYWAEHFWHWKPIATAIGWVKTHRLLAGLITVITVIAAIVTIVGWILDWIG